MKDQRFQKSHEQRKGGKGDRTDGYGRKLNGRQKRPPVDCENDTGNDEQQKIFLRGDPEVLFSDQHEESEREG